MAKFIRMTTVLNHSFVMNVEDISSLSKEDGYAIIYNSKKERLDPIKHPSYEAIEEAVLNSSK